jgi:adenylosuccinate synthase
MKADCVLGLQWGDEGKGKIVDALAGDYRYVVRFNGGDNAGHAVKHGGRRVGLRQVPSAVLHPGVIKVIAAGAVVNPFALLEEVAALAAAGLPVDDLLVSERAHLILPSHLEADACGPATTGRGIGPAYAAKLGRAEAVRAGDALRLLDDGRGERLPAAARDPELRAVLRDFARAFAGRIVDTTRLLNQALDRGERVLLEGAQGALLDVDHGSYPFVTASSTVAGGACSGAGLSPHRIGRIVGVVKAYATRVGSGPFPTAAAPAEAEALRQRGLELGDATGMLRRCGWLDLVALAHAVMIDRPDALALTKLDVVGALETIPVCVGYRTDGRRSDAFPADPARLAAAEPIYETLPGWPGLDRARWREVAAGGALPASVARFCELVSSRVGVPVELVSFGAEREDTLRQEDR